MLAKTGRSILKELQDNFPVCSRPYAVIARKFAVPEDDLLRRIARFKKQGLIRYVGATFDTGKLGIVSTLVAMSVPRAKISRSVRIINSYPQVSHNYLRRGEFNIWFTLSAGSAGKLDRLLKEIKKRTGISRVMDLRTEKVFKIDARFKF